MRLTVKTLGIRPSGRRPVGVRQVRRGLWTARPCVCSYVPAPEPRFEPLIAVANEPKIPLDDKQYLWKLTCVSTFCDLCLVACGRFFPKINFATGLAR